MHANKTHITTYSAADIQDYLQGKLSAEEMHAMEKAALDDPFLADAIEGMEQAMLEQQPSIIHAQLTDLRQQLQARTATAKAAPVIRPFRWWYAAAAASIVILGSIWIYNLSSSSEKERSLVVTNHKPAEEKAQAPVTADTISANATTATQQTYERDVAATTKPSVQSQKAFKAKVPAVDSIQSNITIDLAAIDHYSYNPNQTGKEEDNKIRQALDLKIEGIFAQKDKNARDEKADTVQFGETFVVKVAEDLRKNNLYKPDGNSNNSNLQNFIKGRVIDQYNNPISNASLRIENNKNQFAANQFATDHLGNFKIPATDSVVNVSVNVAGYMPQQFRLNNNIPTTNNDLAVNQLRLQPSANDLSEMVVIGYGNQKKKSVNAANIPKVMVQDAAPSYGWVAYEQYLQKNKKPPADNPYVTGEVVVSFQVNKKGELADFTIEQSLAKGYDEEAIRLIKDGPSWKLLKGRKAKVTVIVRF